MHKVGRVLSFSPVVGIRNWNSPNPSPAGECVPPPPVLGGGHTRWRERGWESPNSGEGTYTVVLFILTYFVSTCLTCFPTTLGMLVLCMIYAVGNGFSPPPPHPHPKWGKERGKQDIFLGLCFRSVYGTCVPPCLEHVKVGDWVLPTPSWNSRPINSIKYTLLERRT